MRCCPGSSASGRVPRGIRWSTWRIRPAPAPPIPCAWPGRRPGCRAGRTVFVDRGLRLGALTGGYRAWRATAGPFGRADLVHVHSNGLLPEAAVLLARARRHAGGADAVRHRDLALPAAAGAAGSVHARLSPGVGGHVLQRSAARPRAGARAAAPRPARDLSPGRRRHSRRTTRPPRPRRGRRCGMTSRHLLLNVKRLHPLAGQRHLIEAMTDVIRDASGHASGDLRHRRAARRAEGGRAIGRRRAARDLRRAGRQRHDRPLLRGGGSVRAALAARGAADRRGRGARLRHPGGLDRQSGRARAATTCSAPTSRSCRASSPSPSAPPSWSSSATSGAPAPHPRHHRARRSAPEAVGAQYRAIYAAGGAGGHA